MMSHPHPYEPAVTGKVVGYAGRFGPGRQSLLIGIVCVGLQLLALASWHFAPDAQKLLAIVFGFYLAPAAYLLLLPTMIIGAVRATTACRLGIEFRARTVGVVLNLLGIAIWVTPFLRAGW